jgi:anti-sigma regulatory factor (Ser/Thr protein kinase)
MTTQFELAPDVDAIGEARAHVRESLAAVLDTDTLACAELVVSELVTNSIRYGPGKPIYLRLTTDEASARVVGEVHDQGDGVVAIRQQDVDPPVGGLGLTIVDQLTSAWGVYPGSTHVWFRFD